MGPYDSGYLEKPKKKQEVKASWELAMIMIASGFAFLIVSIVLAFQPMGLGWWFWLLIPGFGALGIGLGQVMTLRQQERSEIRYRDAVSGKQVTGHDRQALPPNRIVPAEEELKMPEKKAEFAPPSVTDDTTRHLEMDLESETTKLQNEE
jgi:hypothetical protein